MPREKTSAEAQAQVRQISIEDVASAVTQGVLRAIAAQRDSLIRIPPTTGGAALEFIVQFGSAGAAGGGLARLDNLGTTQMESSVGKTKK